MSIKNIVNQSLVPKDLAESLGPSGIKLILEIAWEAYHELRDVQGYKADSTVHENSITENWAVFFTRKWFQHDRAVSMSITPLHQFEDDTLSESKNKGGMKPTIDFGLRESFPNNRYFGIECKRLAENDNKKLRYYMKEGIERYVTGKYGATCSEDAIMAYVVGGNIQNVISEVREALLSYPQCISPMARNIQFEEPTYSCICVRPGIGIDVKIDQLFLDFV